MGMNRHDAYYEPDDYDDRSDEIEERTWELMKVGGKFDYRTTSAIAEALSELGVAVYEIETESDGFAIVIGPANMTREEAEKFYLEG